MYSPGVKKQRTGMERNAGEMALLTQCLSENRGGDSFYPSREAGSGPSYEHMA